MWIRTARERPFDGLFFNLDHFKCVMCIQASDYVAANEIPEEKRGEYNPTDLVIVANDPDNGPFVPLARIETTGRQSEIAEKILDAISTALSDKTGLLDLMAVAKAGGFNFRAY